MKVRLLRDTDGPNPMFNAKEYSKARAERRKYPYHHSIIIPKGTEIDHPDAHIHCRPGVNNAPPLAEPVDDEAKAEHAAYLLTVPGRLLELKALAEAVDPNTAYGKDAIACAKAYGLIPQEIIEDE